MAVFHFHFPTPPDDTHFDAAPVCPDHPGAAALREYWQTRHSDAPAVKAQTNVVANATRAANTVHARQDAHYNELVLLAWQLVRMDGLSVAAACLEVGIAPGTYRKRVGRLRLEPVADRD